MNIAEASVPIGPRKTVPSESFTTNVLPHVKKL